ncbi:hypothetical protein EUTSA_v10011960mg [Eutrema salsugineum]|uniref:F-box associated beta-propeller type 3 domain-containing protein n=1 Tax=Eutrema salsugineum TaxID=72664 RepID=V4KLJ8_EUTSA|nr:hypothetical protein EUTSA_v10011960mg [Eutrema salsugineum]
MEQQEKKKRKNYRRRRQSKSVSSFHIDLTSEILLRLPEKSVAKFRCMSLLLCCRKEDGFFVSSIPQYNRISNRSSYSSSHPIDRHHVKFPGKYSRLRPTASVQGLICFQESETLLIWNPSKRQFLTLPKPRKSWDDLTVLLGYDPINDKHKVVCLSDDKDCDVCRVLTLGSAQESWRTVRTNYNHHFYDSGRCIKGVIYYTLKAA